MLHGRDAECLAVDRLIAAARGHHGSTLVVRGDAGVGKSALLRYAIAQASGMTVLHATGVEAEIELSFAAAHQLLRPVLPHIGALPAPQAEALRAAMGLEIGQHGRFLVSVGVLSLLADVAEPQPLLVVVDDAQWLDRASADALVFAARRLDAERIAMLFAAREGERTRFAADGLPELRLEGLDPDAAAALLDERLPAEVPPHVRGRLVELIGGNPLALVELPLALSPAQLAGRTALPDPLPVGNDVERAFLHRVTALPDRTRTLLLVAAADDLGEVDVVLRAGARLGCGAEDLTHAEAAGLVVVEGSALRFRHPLVRSAVYKGAGSTRRRAAHAALADELDRPVELDRRAWHRAAATVGRDRAVADELERSAQRARERSGYAAAAAALERAAELSPAPRDAARHLIAAADAAWHAGQLERAGGLLDGALPLVEDPRTAADLVLLRGRCERASGTIGRAYDIFARGAAQVEATDTRRAMSMWAGAGLAAWGRNDAMGLGQAAQRLAALGSDACTADDLPAQVVQALARIAHGDAPGARPLVTRAMATAERAGGTDELALAGAAALCVGDDAGSVRLLGRAEARARAQGAVAVLVDMAAPQALSEAWNGRIRSAMAYAREGLALARPTGHHSQLSVCQAALAWIHALTGGVDACRAAAAEAARAGLEREFAPTGAIAAWALGLSLLGAGHRDEAHEHLGALVHGEGPTVHPLIAVAATGDIVEAAMVAGAPDTARGAVAGLERFAGDGGPRWARAVAARCRALIGDTGDPEACFATALGHHAQGTRPFEHGRTLLSYGAWLRRRRRRTDARQHLRAALLVFERLEAAGWQDRARAELRATGATVGGADHGSVARLTPRELQIVRIVREGATNKQIATQLYLSPRTVDYHLRKVFVKLGLASRAELMMLAADDPELGRT